MADSSYLPKIYKDNGGDNFNAVSGATVNIEAGVTETHANQPSFSGGFVQATETGTTSANLVNYGLSTIVAFSTSVAVKGYTLANPVAGLAKSIAAITASSTAGSATVTTQTTDCTFDGLHTIATFTSQGFLGLVGISSARWAVVGISTGYSAGSVVLS